MTARFFPKSAGRYSASFLCNIIFASEACLAVPYFPKYLIHDTIFGKKKYGAKYVLILSTTYV